MRRLGNRILYAAVIVIVLVLPSLTPAQAPGEREIQLQPAPPTGDRESPLEVLGLRKPEVAGLRISAFLVGSFNYNSHIQLVPEFAGGAPASADPGSTNLG